MIITDNMGVFHLVQNFAQGKSPTDLILTRYLQPICLRPILGVIHKPSRQVFTRMRYRAWRGNNWPSPPLIPLYGPLYSLPPP